MYTAPVKAKDAQTILTELLMFVAAMRAQGRVVRVIRFDSGREFTAEDTKAALANTGVHAEFTTADRFINNAERAHLTLQRGERAVLTAAPEVPARWRVHARAYAAFSHNLALPSAGGLSPYSRLFPGRVPDRRAHLPFGSQVAAFDTPRPAASFNRAVLAIYIGPAVDHGAGAISVLVDGHLREVATFRYLAPPGAHLDERTLRPRATDGQMPVDVHPGAALDADAEDDAAVAAPRRSSRPCARPAVLEARCVSSAAL